MTGIVLIEVKYPNEPAYVHRHVWMSERSGRALVELINWKRETEQEQQCSLTIKEWTL